MNRTRAWWRVGLRIRIGNTSCAEEYFSHRLPLDPSQMTRFRQHIGESGCKLLFSLTVQAGVDTYTVKLSSLSVVKVDTTVQKKKRLRFPPMRGCITKHARP